MSNERFTKEETTEIIRRALDLQSGKKESQTGMTSALEIRAAAAEIGIDPTFIDQAISTRGRSLGTQIQKGFLGTTKKVTYGGVFPGNLSDDQWVEVVQNLRTSFDSKGTIEELGSTREWFGTKNGLGSLHFSVKNEENEMRVNTSTDLTPLGLVVSMIGLPIWMFTSIGMATLPIPVEFKATILALWFGIYVLVSRHITQLGGERIVRQMKQCVEDFQAISLQSKPVELNSTDQLRSQMESTNPDTQTMPNQTEQG
jgi:hypothetical protein